MFLRSRTRYPRFLYWAITMGAVGTMACTDEDLLDRTDPPPQRPPVKEDPPVEEPPVETPPKECVETTSVVDTDKDFSTFEVGYALSGVAGIDGMVIDSPRPSELKSEERWTISSVEVLVLRPTKTFTGKLADKADNYELAVDLWDGADPTVDGTRHWTETVQIPKSALKWEAHGKSIPLTFGPDASCEMDYECEGQPGGNCDAFAGRCVYASPVEKAWIQFDLTGKLGAENLTSSKLTVGVHWLRADSPLVAGSEYEKSCYDNWNRRDEGGKEGTLKRLSTDPKKTGCNWPLVRVRGQTVRKIQEGESCQ